MGQFYDIGHSKPELEKQANVNAVRPDSGDGWHVSKAHCLAKRFVMGGTICVPRSTGRVGLFCGRWDAGWRYPSLVWWRLLGIQVMGLIITELRGSANLIQHDSFPKPPALLVPCKQGIYHSAVKNLSTRNLLTAAVMYPIWPPLAGRGSEDISFWPCRWSGPSGCNLSVMKTPVSGLPRQ